MYSLSLSQEAGQGRRRSLRQAILGVIICEKIYFSSESYPTYSDARKREAQIKRWSRAKKEALISGDMDKLRLLAKSKKSRN